jgi:hypothetical protein
MINMTPRLKIAISIAVAAFLAGGLFFYLTSGAKDVKREISETNLAVDRLDTAQSEFKTESAEHKTQTVKKVVEIREAVRQEVLALGPDNLARFALDEIELWRSGSGRSADSSASRLDE